MRTQRLAESLTLACVVRGHVMRPPRLAEPAHAVRQPRRRQTHLRVTKTLADLAEHIAGRYAQPVEMQHAVTAGETGVQRIHQAFQPDFRTVHVRQEHRRRAILHLRHDDGEARAFRPGDEPLAATDQIVIAIAHRRRHQHRRIGAGTGRRLGHRKAGANRTRDQRLEPTLLLFRRGDDFHQMDVALVRRVNVQRYRPQG